VPVTNDAPKFGPEDAATQLLAVLSSDGFVDSTEVGCVQPARLQSTVLCAPTFGKLAQSLLVRDARVPSHQSSTEAGICN
jgi:hypothetical protein